MASVWLAEMIENTSRYEALPLTGSLVRLATVALTAPFCAAAAPGMTTASVTFAVAPAASAPSGHVTTVSASEQDAELLATFNCAPDGTVAVTTTPSAASGPLFLTARSSSAGAKPRTLAGRRLPESARSAPRTTGAAGPTVVGAAVGGAAATSSSAIVPVASSLTGLRGRLPPLLANTAPSGPDSRRRNVSSGSTTVSASTATVTDAARDPRRITSVPRLAV